MKKKAKILNVMVVNLSLVERGQNGNFQLRLGPILSVGKIYILFKLRDAHIDRLTVKLQ